MVVGSLVGAVIGLVLGTLVNGVLVWIVGRLGIGMKVDGFRSAFIAGFLIALGGVLAGILWNITGGTPSTGLAGAISNLIIATAVLFGIGRALPGVEVKGWGGALVAAIAIAVVGWLITLLLGALL